MSPQLIKVANENGLSAYLEILERFVRPAIGMTLRGGEAALGSSKLGGGPDLSEGLDLPQRDGKPLDFLLQINLAEVAAYPAAAELPSSGLLSFFYDTENQPWGFDPVDSSAHRVIYTPATETIVRRAASTAESSLSPATIAFWPLETLPSSDSLHGRTLEVALEQVGFADEDALYDLPNELANAFDPTSPSEETLHLLLGHSANVQGGMEEEAQLVSHGFNCGDGKAFVDPRGKELMRDAGQWKLLLQLDSDESYGMMWGDLGRLYFWIRQEDLTRGDFSRTWMTLQCS